MRYYLILLTLWAFFALNAFSQSPEDRGLTISGTIQDAELKEPMMQATVQLFRQRDSTFVGGTVSDIRGHFSIQAPTNGIYRLKISSIGYQPIQREVTLRRNQSIELGDLLLSSDAVLLKEAVVTGRAAQVVVRKDTLVYNPDAYRTPEGSPIEELIKRMPGAEVDEDGNITVNGKKIEKILVDGKEFMLGDVETALKNLPVSIIQSVKFYDQQSDQARTVVVRAKAIDAAAFASRPERVPLPSGHGFHGVDMGIEQQSLLLGIEIRLLRPEVVADALYLEPELSLHIVLQEVGSRLLLPAHARHLDEPT